MSVHLPDARVKGEFLSSESEIYKFLQTIATKEKLPINNNDLDLFPAIV